MSFSRPQRSPYGGLRHSRSTSTLTGLSQARRSRNSFQRRPLRPSHSTQCLFPATAVDEEAEEGPLASCTTSAALYAAAEDLSGSDSEYSEYDLVNEQMQDFLLDSDNSSGEDGGGDGVLGVAAYCVSGFLASDAMEVPHPGKLRRRTATPSRRRMAKKADSGTSLSSLPRVTPSSSTTLLCDLDTNLRDVVSLMTVAPPRDRKQRRNATTDRRWLVPPLAYVFDDGTGSRTALPLFTVVLDLDETLIGARFGPLQLRPFVGDFLRALHAAPVEIIVWTAGTAHYVNPILHAIGQACGRRQWFHHIISRHRRWYTGANTSVKDLTQLGRPLDRVVMIENNPISVLQQPDLCILLEDYLQANPADESLLALKGVLLRFVDACERARRSAAGASCHGGAAAPRTAPASEPNIKADGGNPLSLGEKVTTPCLRTLIDEDPALLPVVFRVEDVCNEDGVSMNQKVEMRERVGGADTVVCHALRYSPSSRFSASFTQTALSSSVRSYGCVNPLLGL